MSPQDPSRAVHDEIRDVLGDRSLRGEPLDRALFALGARHLIEPYRALLLDLLGFDRPESRARATVLKIEAHRSVLAAALGGDPGFEVAALDYLHEIEGTLREPVFQEGPAAGDPGPRARPQDAPPGGEGLELLRAARSGRSLACVTLEPDAPGSLGGAALAEAVAAVREAARDTDLARGGNGGVALLLPCTAGPAALQAADRYRRVLAGSTGTPWSGGVAAGGAGALVPSAIEGESRRALLQARAAGGDRVHAAHPERRAHPRRHAAGAIGARLLVDGAAEDIVIEDLSLGGARLHTRRALVPGSGIVLSLRGSAVRARDIVLPSRVERTRARPGEPLPWQAAVAFPAGGAARLRLATLLADLPAAAPVASDPGSGGSDS